MSVRVFIYGSCVSRDTFGTLDDSFKLLTYVARQSLISVGQPAAGISERFATLASPFQDRMVRGDLAGSLLDEVTRFRSQIDVLLMDLTDERGGVLALGGGYVTKLAEFWGNGGRELARGAVHIPLGSAEHLRLWCEGFDRMWSRLQELGLSQRVLLLDTPWADTLDTGEPLAVPAWMMPPSEANAAYRPYVAHARSRGAAIVTLPDELVASTANHRWGASPFHYTDAAYAYLAGAIRRFAGVTAPATPS